MGSARAEISELLRKSLDIEDRFVLTFGGPAITGLLRTLDKSKFSAISALLNENINDTNRHRNEIRKLISEIDGGKYEL